MEISTLLTSLFQLNPFLIILIVCCIDLLLYFMRMPAHKAINSLFKAIQNGFRLVSASALVAEKQIIKRNKDVLQATGEESLERLIENEFYRVNTIVSRDIGGFPSIVKNLSDQIAKIDEDYRASSELPAPSPEWVNAIDAIVNIKTVNPETYGDILDQIHESTVAQFEITTQEYRKSVGKRHELLSKMLPHWRKLEQTLQKVAKTVVGLQERSLVIDNKMKEYEEIRNKTDKANRLLSSSSFTQLFISTFVLVIAIAGAMINFHLIALPMSEMVGGSSYLGDFKMSDISALVIILVEVAAGLFLMELLRITRLFPLIGQMDDKIRKRLGWCAFASLFCLASIESGLAFMRDQMAANNEILKLALAGVEEQFQEAPSNIPMYAQMLLGFILPFVLTFVAIPLESFVHSSRTVLGAIFAAIMQWFAFLFRLVGNIAFHIGKFLINLYDLLIVLPLWIELKINKGNDKTADAEGDHSNGKNSDSSENMGDEDSFEMNYEKDIEIDDTSETEKESA